jgi:transcriptional regulator with XRE-family HTH domain
MATVKQLRLKARLSIQALGRLANVDAKTIRRAEGGLPVQELKAVAIVEALGQALGQDLTTEDVDNLHIYGENTP